MKKNSHFPKLLLNAVFISTLFIGFSSCGGNDKDSKEVAEEHNDEKFDDNKEEDAEFLVEAAEISFEEIELGKLAQKHSKNSSVIQLGEMMQKDHEKSLAEIKAVAEKYSISIPSSMTEKGQDAYDKLNKEDMKNFDKKYCKMMVDGHKDAIKLFEDAVENVSNTEIREWAASTLSTLRMHLDHSMSCHEEIEKNK
ncbi:MAG: hypothetical protein K0R65_307 [Crocinitomicaceae bacterium]|jgi:putative membrane protein|nr:hypothetical protein [Crocinitomicaceae bacterium]